MGTWLLHENEHKTLQIIVNTVFPYQHQTSPSNLHRHQKNKKTKPISQNIGKHQKKKKKSQHLLRILDPHRLEIFVFFGFVWCLPMFCEIVLCFFFCFFWCLPMSWEIKATKHWQEKKTQPLDAQNSDRHQKKIQHQLRILEPHRLEIFVFFAFFGACQCFVRLCFVFFGACHCFSSIITKQDAKMCVSPRFQSHQMQKTSAFRMFCAHFHSKITSPWSPALLINWVGGLGMPEAPCKKFLSWIILEK